MTRLLKYISLEAMTKHEIMLRHIQQNPSLLAAPLGVPQIWIRGVEYGLSSGDRVDMVVQDHTIVQVGPDTTCYVIELKSDKGDHEILGQLKKAIIHLQRIGESTHHWRKTVGVAIAPKYTKSGLQLLFDENMIPLLWLQSTRLCRARRDHYLPLP